MLLGCSWSYWLLTPFEDGRCLCLFCYDSAFQISLQASHGEAEQLENFRKALPASAGRQPPLLPEKQKYESGWGCDLCTLVPRSSFPSWDYSIILVEDGCWTRWLIIFASPFQDSKPGESAEFGKVGCNY